MSDLNTRASGLIDSLRALPLRWRLAGIAALVWLFLVLIYGVGFFFGAAAPRGAVLLEVMIFLLAGALPIVFFAIAAHLSQTAATLSAQAARLEARLADTARLRQAAQPGPDGRVDIEALVDALPRPIDPTEKLEAIDAKLRRLLDRPAPKRSGLQEAFTPPPAAPPSPPTAPDTPSAEDDLSVADVTGALDFPFNTASVRALIRKVRSQPEMASLMRAAEDLLNALSDDGIFVDDLRQGRADASEWRAHAADKTQTDLAQHQGTDICATVAGKLGDDRIFSDAAAVFLKRFHEVLAEIAEEGSDADLIALADSRTGRAYALILSARKS